MATTEKNIYYPDDYTKVADIPDDMKKMAESIDEAFENNKYDDTKVKKDITDIKLEQTTQNEDIEKNSNNITKIQNECNRIINQLEQKSISGTEITLKDSADIRLKSFDIDTINTSNLVVSNKNLLDLKQKTGNGITVDKNRISIVNPTGSLDVNTCNLLNNKYLSGKYIFFTLIVNGTISNDNDNNIQLLFRTNKNSYRVQKIFEEGEYNNNIYVFQKNFVSDEVITQVYVYSAGATCNLTIDVQVSIVDPEFIEHQGAEFQITSANKDEIIKQIIENGTYQDVTHFYIKDETHANMSLEYYQSLDASLNKYKAQLPIRTSNRYRDNIKRQL